MTRVSRTMRVKKAARAAFRRGNERAVPLEPRTLFEFLILWWIRNASYSSDSSGDGQSVIRRRSRIIEEEGRRMIVSAEPLRYFDRSDDRTKERHRMSSRLLVPQ